MSRDHRKLAVFHLADDLAKRVYRSTAAFPTSERYGLGAQLRRAAVSAATNIVEGSARRSEREYLHFLNIAAGSTAESRYLVELSNNLQFISRIDADELTRGYRELAARLERLMQALSPKP